MLRGLMRIRFCSLATNDFSKNTLPLFFPDEDVHTASTSSPSSKQRGDRTGSHSPANQSSPIVYPCSQAPGSPQFPLSSRAGGCSPTNQQTWTPYPRNQAHRTSRLPHASRVWGHALGVTCGRSGQEVRHLVHGPSHPHQAQKWRRARFPSGLKNRRGIQLPDRQSLGFSWA